MLNRGEIIFAEGLTAVGLSEHRRRTLMRNSTESVCVDFLGTVIEVMFDESRAARRYARRYARFLTEAPASRRAFAVRDVDSTVFWFDAMGAYEWPAVLDDPVAIDFLADSVIRREFFNGTEHLFTFHAAAVATARGAVAIIAPSTGGKTTTAVACARRGMPLFTDEECIVCDEAVVPFPRAINLRADGIARLLADPRFPDFGIQERLAARRGRAWTCVSFDELFGAQGLPLPQRLVATYFLRTGGPPATISPLPLGEAIPLVLAAWPRGKRRGVDRVAEVLRLLAAAPPFALTLGSPDETARVIKAAAG